MSHFSVLCTSREKDKHDLPKKVKSIDVKSSTVKPDTCDIYVTLDQPFVQCTNWMAMLTGPSRKETLEVEQLSNHTVKINVDSARKDIHNISDLWTKPFSTEHNFLLLPSNHPDIGIGITFKTLLL